MPMSWPRMTTLSSSSMARFSAMLTAWTRVTSGIGVALRQRALVRERRRQLRVQVVEHGGRRWRRRRKVDLDRRVDFGGDVGLHRLFAVVVPPSLPTQPRLEAADRAGGPAPLDLGRVAVAA